MICDNILVVGGSGDLGRAIVDNLQHKGDALVFSTFNKSPFNYKNCTELKYCYPGNNEGFFHTFNDIPINKLIHCIGVRSSKQSIKETDIEEWKQLFDINVLSLVDIYKNLLPSLRQGKAKILAVSSTASTDCKANSGPYSVSKAGLDALIKTIAEEEKEHGITASIIAPPLFNSKLARELAVLKGYKDLEEYKLKALNGNLIEADSVALKIIDELTRCRND